MISLTPSSGCFSWYALTMRPNRFTLARVFLSARFRFSVPFNCFSYHSSNQMNSSAEARSVETTVPLKLIDGIGISFLKGKRSCAGSLSGCRALIHRWIALVATRAANSSATPSRAFHRNEYLRISLAEYRPSRSHLSFATLSTSGRTLRESGLLLLSPQLVFYSQGEAVWLNNCAIWWFAVVSWPNGLVGHCVQPASCAAAPMPARPNPMSLCRAVERQRQPGHPGRGRTSPGVATAVNAGFR